MNENQITEVSATVGVREDVLGLSQSDLEALSEAERLALVVGSAYGGALADRDEAREMAAHAIARLAEARSFLGKVVPILNDSTWATDSALADSIQAFLDAEPVDSTQTPAVQEDSP